MHTRHLLVAPLLGGILALSLLGCSVAVTEPDAGTTTASPAAGAPAKATDAASDEANESPTVSDGDVARDDAARTEIRDRAATTLSCDGELVLDASHTGETIIIDGICDTLTVHGDIMEIIAGDIGTLLVTGDGNVIYTDALGAAEVAGDINEVRWAGGTPKTSNGGAGNVMMAG